MEAEEIVRDSLRGGRVWGEGMENEAEDESIAVVEVMKGVKDAPFRGVEPSRHRCRD